MSMTDKVAEVSHIALVATKAAVQAAGGAGKVLSRTPNFRFKKDGTAIITLNLEVKLPKDEEP